MKSLSELTDFYYQNLHPVLKELEKQRKQVKFRVLLTGFALTFFTALLFFIYQDILMQYLELMGFAYMGIGALLYKMITKDYSAEFKEKVIHPLINEIDPQLSYNPTSHVSHNLFKSSELFNSKIDRLEGNDFVDGEIDGIKIQFSDLHAQKRHKNSKRGDKWTTIFQGLFIVAEFNKHFKHSTVVLPDTAQKAFGDFIGSWLQSKNLSRNELVKMDNPEFEKHFVVYGSDQIEARYILTHSLMQRILNFRKKSKHPLYISFVGASMHLAIEYDRDLFEASIFHSLLDYKIAMEYVKTLHLAIGIIKELQLNEKLWSKQ